MFDGAKKVPGSDRPVLFRMVCNQAKLYSSRLTLWNASLFPHNIFVG